MYFEGILFNPVHVHGSRVEGRRLRTLTNLLLEDIPTKKNQNLIILNSKIGLG